MIYLLIGLFIGLLLLVDRVLDKLGQDWIKTLKEMEKEEEQREQFI